MSKLPLAVVCCLAVLVAPTVGHAEAPGDLVDPTDTADGAVPMGPTGDLPGGIAAPLDPQKLGAKILYVNFDGQDMNACGNNSPQQNCSTIFGGTVLPYTGDAAKRATIIQIVRKRVEDFGITVTDTRPSSGDYDMEVVGDWQGVNDPGFAGVAPSIDCFDNRGGESSFTLEASGTSDGMAEIILQEVAHTWGLEHIDDQTDLLYPTTQGQNKVFKDECIKIVANTDLDPTGGQCNAVHQSSCNFGFQNSYRDMLAVFGESTPDTTPPLVEIISPADGATIDGGDLDLRIRFDDDQSPVIINGTITIESSALEETITDDGAYVGPNELDFPISGLPDGEYSVAIDATDEEDNPASDQITFTIVGNPPGGEDEGGGSEGGEAGSGGEDESAGEAGGEDESAGGTGGGTGSADGGDDGSASGGGNDDDSDDDDDDSEGDTDVAGAMDTDSGCGCTSQSPSVPVGFAGLALLGLLTVRRRRDGDSASLT